MRGFGRWSFFSNFRTPSPQPSPLWGEGVLCASFCGLAWQAPSFSRRISACEFFGARSRTDRVLAKMWSRLARNRSGPKKVRGGAWLSSFRYAVSSFRRFVARMERSEIRERHRRLHRRSRIALRSIRATKKMKEAERRQTLIRILRILRCGSRLAARSFVGVPPRLSPEGVFHPKGSASGQASWDAV